MEQFFNCPFLLASGYWSTKDSFLHTAVSMNALVDGEKYIDADDRRKARACGFFELLVLKTHSVIHVEQMAPFADIRVLIMGASVGSSKEVAPSCGGDM